MIKRVLALLIPGALLGVAAVALAIVLKGGLLPADWSQYLWPSLVALALLVFSVVAFVVGRKRWLFPLLTGLVVQLLGLLCIVPNPPLVTWWKTMLATLFAVAAVLVAMLAVWAFVLLRARRLERRMTAAAGEGPDQAEITKIRANMDEALKTLAKAGGKGTQSIYLLPWFLVAGRSQGGKSTAIKNSGLSFPLRKDRYKGVGGTSIVDFFFTTEMIFLDTPGRWVSEGTDDSSKRSWLELVQWLRRYRGRRPIDGVMIVVPADFLLSQDEKTLQDDAARIRDVLDLMQQELRFRFPVYLLVSKCDLVEGFVDFFRNLLAQKRPEIFGWSNASPEEGTPARLVARGFRSLLPRLAKLRLEMLVRAGRTRQARRLFLFVEEFKRLQQPLSIFADELFYRDPTKESPVFRGFYFTSGTQGEGVPVTAAMAALARQLGVRMTAAPEQGEGDEPKRAYFLLDLFRELMGKDLGLTGKTTVHTLLERKKALLYVFGPAALAAVVLFLSTLSFFLNWRAYERAERQIPEAVSALRRPRPANLGLAVSAALPHTRTILERYSDMAGFGLLNRMGMRRPGELDDITLQIFRDQFRAHALEPTLAEAQRAIQASDTIVSCQKHIETVQTVVSLAMLRRIEKNDEMTGFDEIWEVGPDLGWTTGRELRDQYAYYLQEGDRRPAALPGFSLRGAAETIRERCSDVDALSLVTRFIEFQGKCATAGERRAVMGCFRDLSEIAARDPEKNRLFSRRFAQLKDDVATLKDERFPEAERAWELLETLRPAEDRDEECLQKFMDTVLPGLSQYVGSADEKASACRDALTSLPVGQRAVELKAKKESIKAQLKNDAERAAQGFESFANDACEPRLPRASQIDFGQLQRFLERYIEQKCLDFPESPPPPPPPPSPPPPPGPPSPPPGQGLLVAGAGVVAKYTADGWQQRKDRWDQQLAAAETLDPSTRGQVQATVRTEVTQYGAEFAAHWNGYLRALRVNTARGPAPVLVPALATTTDFADRLGPAALAARAVSATPAPPYNTIGPRVDALARLDALVNTQLGEYQSLLGELGAALREADQDPVVRQAFRAASRQNDPGNAMVKVKRWVELNAGPNVASGSLQGLFLEPVRIAEAYLGTPSSGGGSKLWADVVSLYADRLAGRFPFSPQGGDNLADLDAVRALLGGKGGLVPALKQSGSDDLPPEAQEWLTRAAALSSALFVGKTDQPRPLKMSFSLGAATFEPAKYNDDLRVDRIQFALGEQTYTWERENPDAPPVPLPLLEGGVPALKVTVFIAEKGLRRWKAPEPQPRPVVQRTGAWAPLEAIAPQYAPLGASSVDWTIDAPYVEGQKEKARMKLVIRVQGDGLAALLDVVRNGLKEPPAAAR